MNMRRLLTLRSTLVRRKPGDALSDQYGAKRAARRGVPQADGTLPAAARGGQRSSLTSGKNLRLAAFEFLSGYHSPVAEVSELRKLVRGAIG
jgi:hypothetical protein